MIKIEASLSVDELFSDVTLDTQSKVAFMGCDIFKSNMIQDHVKNIISDKLNSEVIFESKCVIFSIEVANNFVVIQNVFYTVENVINEISFYLIDQLDKELQSEVYATFHALTDLTSQEIFEKIVEVQCKFE